MASVLSGAVVAQVFKGANDEYLDIWFEDGRILKISGELKIELVTKDEGKNDDKS